MTSLLVCRVCRGHANAVANGGSGTGITITPRSGAARPWQPLAVPGGSPWSPPGPAIPVPWRTRTGTSGPGNTGIAAMRTNRVACAWIARTEVIPGRTGRASRNQPRRRNSGWPVVMIRAETTDRQRRPGRCTGQLAGHRGVAAGQIPPGLEARMGLWRDRLAGQQLLLILDDAVGSEQVLPLLPGTGGNLVLVTSRRHLSALDEAAVISLDTLPAGEAAGLLVRLAGRPGLGPGDRGWPRSSGCAGTCRWRSGWWPGSCGTTRRGPRPGGPPSW